VRNHRGTAWRRVLVLEHRTASEKKSRSLVVAAAILRTFMPHRRITSRNSRLFANQPSRVYTAADFVGWVERHGIAYHEKKLGSYFAIAVHA
jgi:predicted flavoprotein YhiN